jgi:hypothetical protein
LLLAGLVGLGQTIQAAPRDGDWAQVEQALAKRQPKTALALLKPTETAAFADRAWGEGTKALLMRARLANGLGFSESPFSEKTKPAEAQAEPVDPFDDPAADPFADSPPAEEWEDFTGLPGCVRQLEGEIATAPAAVRPVLRWFQARWLLAYADERSHEDGSRSKIAARPDDAIEAWDPSRMTAEIEKRFVQALADEKILRATPVAKFCDVLAPRSTLGDKLRPMLYDLVAHSMLEFLTDSPLGDEAVSANFQLPADSPVFDGSEAFLAWHPVNTDPSQPKFRALQIYQSLLAFHRADPDRTAFLHCDLERLRWAGRFATGATKPDRQLAAIQSFITANAAHPLSADARQDEVILLRQRNRTIEAHSSAQAGAAAFPKHPFGKVCQGLVKEMEVRVLEVQTPSAWPVAGDEITLRQRNVEHVWLRLYQRDRQPTEAMLEEERKMDGLGVGKLLRKPPTHAWDVPLDDVRDFRSHGRKLATPLDLSPGDYLLVAADRADFSDKSALTWTAVTVSNLRLGVDPIATGQGQVGGFVLDAESGAPLANVKVEVWQRPDKAAAEKQETRTDANGVFALKRREMPEGGRVLIVASDGNHRVSESSQVWCRGTDRLASGATEKVTFFTDRRIYRPGQTIHFKGILCSSDEDNGDYHTVSDRSLTVTLTGPNKQAVGKVEVTSNERGSFTGTFTAPGGSLLGSFELAAGELGTASIHVEEYKRPKFTVEILPPEAPVVLGQPVTVKGVARTYTGAPVDGAEVEWDVGRGAYFTGIGLWLNWDDNCFDLVELATGKAVTGPDGSFAMTFTAEPDPYLEPAMEPVFDFEIDATVTDPTGESHEEWSTLFAGYTEFSAVVTAGKWQEEGKPVVVEVRTQTHDDTGFPGTGTLRIYDLKQPAACPRDEEMMRDDSQLPASPRSGPAGWELGELVREVAVTTVLDKASGACLAKVPVELPAGAYRVMFEALDSKQRKVVAVTGVQVVKPQADRFPIKTPFYVGSSAWTRGPGQTFTLVWGSGYESARACVEWYRDERLLKREWSLPGRTQQEFSIMPDESMRGGITVRVQQFSRNRYYSKSRRIDVPWSNQELTVKWEHLTSKLEPGAKDTWTAIVTGPDGAPVPAEMVATLYDAALDDLYSHSFGGFERWFRSSAWSLDALTYSGRRNWERGYCDELVDKDRAIQQPFRTLLRALDEGDCITSIGASYSGRVSDKSRGGHITLLEAEIYHFYNPPELPNSVGSGGFNGGFPATPATPTSPPSPEEVRIEAERKKLGSIISRRKLDETAFFYPQLTSDADGKIRISFTMPEGLGKWRFLGFAHDAMMRSGSLEGTTVTAKDLMVQPNPPRFLREGDVLDFTVRISNQSDREQRGLARFTLADAATDHDQTAALGVTTPEQSFQIPAKQSRTLAWRLTVPDGTGFLRYKAVATCGNLSDGEEAWLPVLPRRVMVTDSMALSIRDAGTKSYNFEGLRDSSKSATLQHQSLQVQVVSQPAWYAVLALPYLMEFPHECAEQTFNRYYANSLGRHLVTADPKIRRVFELWRNTPTLDSPLTRHQDLKGILLEETPWLQDAADESQSRRRVGMLFEDANLANELSVTLDKLVGMQAKSGLWPWFPGGPDSEYISLHIVAGFGHLRAMGVDTDLAPALKALGGLDNMLTERYQLIQKLAKKQPEVSAQNHLDPMIAHHLYSRSFFLADQPLEDDALAAHEYFLGQAKQSWPRLQSRMAAAQVALALSRSGDAATAKLITRAFRETAVNRPETGMTWPAVAGTGWWWWQAPIETQAMMIEAFAEIDQDAKAVADCRVALIRQQRGRSWETTTATAEAVHALLAGLPGDRACASDELVKVTLGTVAVEPGAVEPGTGYYEHRIPGAAVKPGMAEVSLTKTEAGIGWASVHWQYFEDVATLAAHESGGMKLEKALFVRRHTPQGPQLEPVTGPVRVGDELVTRLVVRNDQEMEFVHLKDARGSGTEPVNVLSGYRWQDGLGYYEVTRDAATHLFLDRLPVGTHVFEIATRTQHAGIYQSGAAEIRCMYAPEFQARSGSTRLEGTAIGGGWRQLRASRRPSGLRECLGNGRDRSPQRSGEWSANGTDHETLGYPAMGSHSLAILADRPEVGPCLRVFFGQSLTFRPLAALLLLSCSPLRAAEAGVWDGKHWQAQSGLTVKDLPGFTPGAECRRSRHGGWADRQFRATGCVGWHWFKYGGDEPGIHRGLVDPEFRPHQPLLERMREINGQVYQLAAHFHPSTSATGLPEPVKVIFDTDIIEDLMLKPPGTRADTKAAKP